MPDEMCLVAEVIAGEEPPTNGDGGIIGWIKDHMIETAIVGGAVAIGATLVGVSALKKKK